jgi:hypothetical protein
MTDGLFYSTLPKTLGATVTSYKPGTKMIQWPSLLLVEYNRTVFRHSEYGDSGGTAQITRILNKLVTTPQIGTLIMQK